MHCVHEKQLIVDAILGLKLPEKSGLWNVARWWFFPKHAGSSLNVKTNSIWNVSARGQSIRILCKPASYLWKHNKHVDRLTTPLTKLKGWMSENRQSVSHRFRHYVGLGLFLSSAPLAGNLKVWSRWPKCLFVSESIFIFSRRAVTECHRPFFICEN